MKKYIISIIFFTVILMGCVNYSSMKEDGIYAVINTNMGKFICMLYYDKTPITVGNFIGLSEGTKEFIDPKTNEKIKRPFYDGLIFHRIIKDKIIQGGCPLGAGNGSPGYKFVDEFNANLKFDSEGLLSMANNGIPNTNGSQFFLTLEPLPFLDGKYTIFGKVINGIDILKKISNVKVNDDNKPYEDIYIKNIKIVRKGEKAKEFDPEAAFMLNNEVLRKYQEERDIKLKDFLKTIGVDEEKIVTTKIGLRYFVRKNGYGKIPETGDLIKANYTGFLEDGTIFDSSYERKEPIEITIGVGKVISGWDEAFLTMKEGEKRVLIIPDYLGYGEYGNPPVIPPKATLIFEVELLSVKKQ